MYDLLKGLRLVEAAAFIAGPSCGLYLAQMGAEVIRIDTIGGGPDFRRWPLTPGGDSLYWEGLNKAKKSIAIDLSRPQGRELAVQLAAAPGDANGLFVTNFPVEGFLSYEKLKAAREDIICVRVMGWADGRPAVDYTVNAAMGVPMMTGFADDPRPINHTLPAWDLLTGAYAAFCLVSAERARRAGQGGREFRIPLSDIAASTMSNLGQVAEVMMQGADRPRQGNDLFGAFGRDFVTADGRRLMVVALTARQWRGLLQTLGLTEAVAGMEAELGVDFGEHEGVRYDHRARLMPLFEAAFAARNSADLAPAFETAGVCWSTYRSLREAVRETPEYFAENPVFGPAQHPSGLDYPAAGAAATVSGMTREAVRPAPLLGADTDEVLGEVLGLSSAQIGALHDAGIVAGNR